MDKAKGEEERVRVGGGGKGAVKAPLFSVWCPSRGSAVGRGGKRERVCGGGDTDCREKRSCTRSETREEGGGVGNRCVVAGGIS